VNVLEVVGNSSALTGEDIQIHDRLVGQGHSVTYIDDGASPTLTGVSLVVMARSAGGTTVGTKYDAATCGVMSVSCGCFPHSKFCTTSGVGGSAVVAYFVTAASTDPVSGTSVGTTTFLNSTPGQAYKYAASGNLGSGVTSFIAARSDLLTRIVGARYATGAIMSDGTTAAPSRRAVVDLIDVTLVNTVGATWFDQMVSWVTAGALIGPSVSVGSDRTVVVADAVSISASETPGSGSITVRAWTLQSGPGSLTLTGASTSTVSFTTPATLGNYVLRYTVTDANSLTSYDELTVSVNAAGQVARPLTDGALNGWTASNATTPVAAVMADGNVATWAESPTNPTAVALNGDFSPLVNPGSTSGWSLKVSVSRSPGSASGSVDVKVKQGATVLFTKTATATSTDPTAPDVVTFTLSGGEAGSITTPQSLSYECDGTAA
jgi:hypothetical protein